MKAEFPSVRVSGLACASALGETVEAQWQALGEGRTGLRPLVEMEGGEGLPFPGLLAGWLRDRRGWLGGRRYGAASNAAVRAAREAVAAAGWTAREREEAWLFGGSSRANAGEMLGAWPERRGLKKFAASNSMASEVTAAVSIELGIRGPWQMLANGCSAGLDAIGMGWAVLRAGLALRVLVVSVELPLVARLLQGFGQTGLLGLGGRVDPFGEATEGFQPGEAVVALTMECAEGVSDERPEVVWYGANSDAYHSIALPEDGAGLAELLRRGAGVVEGGVGAVCPHGNGTPSNRVAEMAALAAAFSDGRERTLHLVKPFAGHPLGASGALEVALLVAGLRRGLLPGSGVGLTSPSPGWRLPETEVAVARGGAVMKVALGMGGHNAVVVLRSWKGA